MSKGIKFKNDIYLDSSSISHNKKILKDIIEKSAILVFLTANTTISAGVSWGTYRIPFNGTRKRIGTAFMLQADGTVKYTGRANFIKMTLGITRGGGTTAGSLYPCSNWDTYYQQLADTTRAFAVYNYIAPATGDMIIEGVVRTSATGNIVLTGDGNSCYNYMLLEEI